jgi:hypothetical protein
VITRSAVVIRSHHIEPDRGHVRLSVAAPGIGQLAITSRATPERQHAAASAIDPAPISNALRRQRNVQQLSPTPRSAAGPIDVGLRVRPLAGRSAPLNNSLSTRSAAPVSCALARAARPGRESPSRPPSAQPAGRVQMRDRALLVVHVR